jgi:hypothetical protein
VTDDYDPSPSIEQILALDSLPSFEVSEHEIVLPSGIRLDSFLILFSPTINKQTSITSECGVKGSIRDTLIALMAKQAKYLVDDRQHQYAKEGDNAPELNGLAYSYGSRTLERSVPPKGTCNSISVRGVDCSGMLYLIMKGAGLPVNPNIVADQQRKPAYWNSLFESVPSLKGRLEAKDKGALPVASVESGDIIYWLDSANKAEHIGLVLNVEGKRRVFQSNGTSGKKGNCSTNYQSDLTKKKRRGPRNVDLASAIRPTSQNGFGTNYGILRIENSKPNDGDPTVIIDTNVCVDARLTSNILPIDVEEGDKLTFSEVIGNWCFGGADCSGPEGFAGRPLPNEGPVTMGGENFCVLVGRIATERWFRIGAGVSITSSCTGQLELIMNDKIGAYGDNSGNMCLRIVIERKE